MNFIVNRSLIFEYLVFCIRKQGIQSNQKAHAQDYLNKMNQKPPSNAW